MSELGTDGDTDPTKPERRQITFVFCDMVGSTVLANENDPEDYRRILISYRQICANAIEAFGGFVAQFVGDGVVGYFGYPEASEFEAENAVRASLQIIEDLARHAVPPLEAHIGISTGLVVVGDLPFAGGKTERHQVVGKAPNRADRLMKLAVAGQVLVDEATAAFVHDLFELIEMGEHPVKGFAAPIKVWQVGGESAVRSGSQVMSSRTDLARLIGRDEEIDRLRRTWAKVEGGAGQVVMLNGEPGIGKSRIVRHLKEFITKQRVPVKEVFFSASQQNSPLHAIADQIERDVGVQIGSTKSEKGQRFTEFIDRLPNIDDRKKAVFRNFMSLDNPGRALLQEMSLKERRELILEILEEWLSAYSKDGPVLIVVEDAHWGDSTTLELIERLIRRRVNALPMLVVVTSRLGFVPAWLGEHYVESITLRRLSPDDSALLLDDIPEARHLPASVVDLIVARSDGVPLFLEEVCKATIETISANPDGFGRGGIPDNLGVPNSLSSSLMARLDRLGPVKHIAQIISAFGKRFTFEMLDNIADVESNELLVALKKLERSEIVVGALTDGVAKLYDFKHALLREAAYASMLRSERAGLHERIAFVIEQSHPEIALRDPEFVAVHCERGGLRIKAVEYRLKAGDRAFESSANADAYRHYLAGLEVLERLSDSFDSRTQEMNVRVGLARSSYAMHGGGFAEVGEHFAHARELAQKCGNRHQHFLILLGCWLHDFMSANHNAALSLTAEALRFADELGDDHARAEANRISGMSKLFTGEFAQAYEHLKTVKELYDTSKRRRDAARSGLDPLVCCDTYLALASLYLGRVQEAQRLSEGSLSSARLLSHPYSYVFSLALNAFLRQALDDVGGARELAMEAVSLARENGFGFWEKQQTVVVCWADARADLTDATVQRMRRAVSEYLESGQPLESTRALSLMAEICILHGQPDDALEYLAAAMEIADATGERFYLAEIHRLRAAAIGCRPGAIDAAERHLHLANAVADSQGAGLWRRKIADTARDLLGGGVDQASGFS